MEIRERAPRSLIETPRRYASPMSFPPNEPDERPLDWPHYREAVLHFGDPVVWSVPASQLAREAPRRLPAVGLFAPFAIVTAFHPYPRRLADAENLARHDALRQAIESLGALFVPCAGSSADGSHREEGFAIACPRGTALALAAEFGQAAIYWWDGTSLWIDPVQGGPDRERLRS